MVLSSDYPTERLRILQNCTVTNKDEDSVVAGEVSVRFKTLLVVAVFVFLAAVVLILAVRLIIKVDGGLHGEISEKSFAVAEEVVKRL